MSYSFEESLAKFQYFLEKNGYPRNIVWVTPNDVLISGDPQVYVKVPVSPDNERFARKMFEIGMSQQKGVVFDTVCEGEGVTFSFAWVPRDDSDREESLMTTGLKLSAKTGTNRVHGRAIKNWWYWLYLQLRHRSQQRLQSQLFRL